MLIKGVEVLKVNPSHSEQKPDEFVEVAFSVSMNIFVKKSQL